MYPQACHDSNRILHLGTESSSQLYKSLSKQPLGHNKAKEPRGGKSSVERREQGHWAWMMKSISERRCQGGKEFMGGGGGVFLRAQQSLRESVCAVSVRLVFYDVNNLTKSRRKG